MIIDEEENLSSKPTASNLFNTFDVNDNNGYKNVDIDHL